MFKPFGFLKKVFGGVHKAVKGTHNMVGKAAGKLTGGLTDKLPGAPKQNKKVSNLAPKSTGAPADTTSPRINPIGGGGPAMGGAISRRTGGVMGGRKAAGSLSQRLGGHRKML